jgi:hypothetical protein
VIEKLLGEREYFLSFSSHPRRGVAHRHVRPTLVFINPSLNAYAPLGFAGGSLITNGPKPLMSGWSLSGGRRGVSAQTVRRRNSACSYQEDDMNLLPLAVSETPIRPEPRATAKIAPKIPF